MQVRLPLACVAFKKFAEEDVTKTLYCFQSSRIDLIIKSMVTRVLYFCNSSTYRVTRVMRWYTSLLVHLVLHRQFLLNLPDSKTG